MKYNDTLSAPAHGTALRDLFAPVTTAAATLGGKIATGFGNAVTHMQISRMSSVLSSMDDAQLEAAGIERADIPQHARALVLEEYDGL